MMSDSVRKLAEANTGDDFIFCCRGSFTDDLTAQVLELNREAARHLRAPHQLDVVPGAGHLFEEPGALEQVTRHARDWFLECFELPVR